MVPGSRIARSRLAEERARREGAAQEQGAELWARVFTLNVGTAAGREQAIMAWANEQEADVVCLQETRLAGQARVDFARMAKEGGYQVHFGDEDHDRSGAATRGIAMLTRNSGFRVRGEASMPNPKRVMAYKMHREGLRPLLVLNVYMPAGPGAAAIEREALIHDTIEWAVGTGEDFLAIGDWNCEDDAVPLGELVAAGGLQQADQA